MTLLDTKSNSQNSDTDINRRTIKHLQDILKMIHHNQNDVCKEKAYWYSAPSYKLSVKAAVWSFEKQVDLARIFEWYSSRPLPLPLCCVAALPSKPLPQRSLLCTSRLVITVTEVPDNQDGTFKITTTTTTQDQRGIAQNQDKESSRDMLVILAEFSIKSVAWKQVELNLAKLLWWFILCS